jgi:hypothetical protein
LGAIAFFGSPHARLALWLGITAVLACGSLLATMIYRDLLL